MVDLGQKKVDLSTFFYARILAFYDLTIKLQLQSLK